MTKHIQFNYAVAHYWDKDERGAIGAYFTYSNSILFGTLEDAKDHLEYVKQQSPDRDWRIFEVRELKLDTAVNERDTNTLKDAALLYYQGD